MVLPAKRLAAKSSGRISNQLMQVTAMAVQQRCLGQSAALLHRRAVAVARRIGSARLRTGVAVSCQQPRAAGMQSQLPAYSPQQMDRDQRLIHAVADTLEEPAPGGAVDELLQPRQFAATSLPRMPDHLITNDLCKMVRDAMAVLKVAREQLGQALDDQEANHLGDPAHVFELIAAVVEARRQQHQHLKQRLSALEAEGQGKDSAAFQQLQEEFKEVQEAWQKAEAAWQGVLYRHQAGVSEEWDHQEFEDE